MPTVASHGPVAELADAPDLGSGLERGSGSTPDGATNPWRHQKYPPRLENVQYLSTSFALRTRAVALLSGCSKRMYNAFFGFEKDPFSSRPDPAFFYRSSQHDTSLRSLMFAVQARMGLSSLAGEAGTGKTILLGCLRDALESAQTQCAFLRDSRISTNQFYQAIAAELDLRCEGTSPDQVFSALYQFTLQQARKGRTVALIVDDAHHLPADVLNEILRLASLHDQKVKLIQTILAGRPELHTTLDALNLDRLEQHSILGCHLDPFTDEETERYIEFRLAKAGLSEQTIFPPGAISEIYQRTRGFVPAIHATCEELLWAAFSEGSKVCTPEILDQVFTEREPPVPKTTLLRLAFVAIQSLPPPLPVNTNALPAPQRTALPVVHPTGMQFPGCSVAQAGYVAEP